MRRRSGIVLAMALGGVAVVVGCAGTLEGDEADYRIEPEPGCDVIPIFAEKCATSSCHGGSTPQQGLDLGRPGVQKRTLGVASRSTGCEARLLVDPADVNKSFLLEKIENGSPSCGDPMPLIGELSDTEKACIRTWAVAITGGPKDAGSGPPPGNPDSGRPTSGDAGGTP